MKDCCIYKKNYSDKNLIIKSLIDIPGIGFISAKNIMNKLKLNNERFQDVSDEKITALKENLDQYIKELPIKNYQNLHYIDESLKLKKFTDIEEHKKNKTYIGYRHIMGYKVHGQKANYRKNKKTRLKK